MLVLLQVHDLEQLFLLGLGMLPLLTILCALALILPTQDFGAVVLQQEVINGERLMSPQVPQVEWQQLQVLGGGSKESRSCSMGISDTRVLTMYHRSLFCGEW